MDQIETSTWRDHWASCGRGVHHFRGVYIWIPCFLSNVREPKHFKKIRLNNPSKIMVWHEKFLIGLHGQIRIHVSVRWRFGNFDFAIKSDGWVICQATPSLCSGCLVSICLCNHGSNHARMPSQLIKISKNILTLHKILLNSGICRSRTNSCNRCNSISPVPPFWRTKKTGVYLRIHNGHSCTWNFCQCLEEYLAGWNPLGPPSGEECPSCIGKTLGSLDHYYSKLQNSHEFFLIYLGTKPYLVKNGKAVCSDPM